uniref:long-chain-fatty-acid--CoA ligase n=1 Tax=Oncorhynchus tshawytscha TaxID=74940 RepID=A0AAZ3S5U1_ONCTS
LTFNVGDLFFKTQNMSLNQDSGTSQFHGTDNVLQYIKPVTFLHQNYEIKHMESKKVLNKYKYCCPGASCWQTTWFLRRFTGPWAMGLDRYRNCLTGAAPITMETLEYFMSLRLPLYELYGMSESTGPHTISWENNFKIMSCGKVVNGCQTKLDKPDEDGNGEICFWGRHEALDQEGWLHSGATKYDISCPAELIITAGGENIPPVPIEDAVKAETAIISNAMLLGDKKTPGSLLTLEALAFCQQRGVMETKASEIIASKEPAVYKAIQEGIELRPTQTDFSISGGELGESVSVRNIYSTSQKFGHTHSINEFFFIWAIFYIIE